MHAFGSAVERLEHPNGVDSDEALAAGAAGAYAERAASAVAPAVAARAALVRVLRRRQFDVTLRGRLLGRAITAFKRGRSLPPAVRSRFQANAAAAAVRSLGAVRRLRLRRALRTRLGTTGIAAQAGPVDWNALVHAAQAHAFDGQTSALRDFARHLRRRGFSCDLAVRGEELRLALASIARYTGADSAVLHWLAGHVTPPADSGAPPGCPGPAAPRPGSFRSFGGFGSGPGQLDRPTDVTVGPGGIYVADQSNSRIQRFTLDGRFVSAWGGRPHGDVPLADGQFWAPVGVALDAAGNVYVSDFFADRVQKFTADGQFITKWGSTGTGDGQFMRVSGITVGPNGRVYVADPINARIQVFDQHGGFIAKFGSASGPGQLAAPRGITTDAAGNVYVAERNLGHAVVFTADGAFVREFGSRGLDPGQFDGIYDIAVDRQGNLWIADYSNYRLQHFTPEGALLGVVDAFGAAGESFNPWAVATDAHGNVYAADIIGGTGDRILVFGGLG